MASKEYQEVPIELLGKEYILEVSFYYTKANPGRLSGPPEDCYPPEDAEVEIDSIKFAGEGEAITVLPDSLIEDLTTHLLENVPEYDPGDDYDARY